MKRKQYGAVRCDSRGRYGPVPKPRTAWQRIWNFIGWLLIGMLLYCLAVAGLMFIYYLTNKH